LLDSLLQEILKISDIRIFKEMSVEICICGN